MSTNQKPGDKEHLSLAANDVKVRLPDQHGFILLTVPFGLSPDDPANRAAYVSDCNRADAIRVLKEFLFRIGEGENWMQHIK